MAMAIANPNPPPTTSRVSPKTIQKAVKALLKWRDSKSQTQKPQLLSDDEFFYLILTLKKIPTQIRTNPYKIPIPHPLLAQELCLIIDDRSHSNLDKSAAKSKIESEQIHISKVLKLSKLKSDYRPFEAKRKLCDSYDMFFVDKRIVPLMPGLLGKHFYQKKKLPVPVDLTHKNWKEQIERACASALVYLRSGTCCVVKVARLSLGKKEIAENVVAAINGVVEIVPQKWDGVRSLHLRLMESVALPVYQAVPEVTLKAEEVEGEKEEVVEKEGKGEEVGVDEGKKGEKVKKKKKKKGRIHEVRYMDVNIGDVFDEDQLGSDEGEDVGEMGSGELESKKRKKGDKSKTEGMDSGKSKRLKKSDKVKKEDGLKENNDGLLAAKGNKEDGVKRKKVGLSVEDVKSSEKKVKKEDGLKVNNDGLLTAKGKKEDGMRRKKVGLSVEDVKSSEKKVKKEDGLKENNDELLAAKGKKEDGVKKKKAGLSVEDVKSSEKKVKNKDGLTENRDGSLATKGRKEDGVRKRKVELPVEDEKSSEKKLKKKKSAVVKLKSGEKEVKPKKNKKAVE